MSHSWLERMQEEIKTQSTRAKGRTSLQRMLERELPPHLDMVSTVHLCDLLGVEPRSGNTRRIARAMRALGWLPVRNRRMLPGGWRGTEGRGWSRGVRQLPKGRAEAGA